MTFDSFEYEKKKFMERTAGLKKQDIEWILTKVIEYYPELKGYKKNKKIEEQLLSKTNLVIYGFDKSRHSNVRAYVEKELRRDGYLHELKNLLNRIDYAKGNQKLCDELEKNLDEAKVRISKEDPEYYKKTLEKEFLRLKLILKNRRAGSDADAYVR